MKIFLSSENLREALSLHSHVYKWSIAPKLKMLKEFLPEAEIYPFGSRYVCDPPVMGTDVDFWIYNKEDITQKLTNAGYVLTSLEYQNSDEFFSYRNGKINLVITKSKRLTDKNLIATHICKKFNIRIKNSRIYLYQAIRDNLHSLEGVAPYTNEVVDLVRMLHGPYGDVLAKAYIAKHDLWREWL